VKRVLQREITNELAKEMLKGKVSAAHAVMVDYCGDGLVFSTKKEKIT
jgi:ATP-dependent Clp protease ATP-binding subunit ClpA